MTRYTLSGHVVVFLIAAVILGACASEGEAPRGEEDEVAPPTGTIEAAEDEAVPQDQEAKLEALLAELRPTLDSEQRAALDSVQTQWQELRGADCRWESSLFEGGTVQSDIYQGCMSQLAGQRIERLKVFLCEGWGMTGSCEASERYDEPE